MNGKFEDTTVDLVKVEILKSNIVIKDIVERFSENCDRTTFSNTIQATKAEPTSATEVLIEKQVRIKSFAIRKAHGMLYSTVGEAAGYTNIEIPEDIHDMCSNDQTRKVLQKRLGISAENDVALMALLEKEETFNRVNAMLREDNREIVPFVLHVLCALRALRPIDTHPLLYVDDSDTDIVPGEFYMSDTFKIVRTSQSGLNMERTHTIEISGDYIAYSLENFGERYKGCKQIIFFH